MRIVYPGGSSIKEGVAASKIVLEWAGKKGIYIIAIDQKINQLLNQ